MFQGSKALGELRSKMDAMTLMAARFEMHLESCDRRYAETERLNMARHDENCKRLDKQDALLNWILRTGVAAVLALVGILAHALLSSHGLNIGLIG